MSDHPDAPHSCDHYKVQIDPAGWVAIALPTQTILQAALLVHIELPHACRNGTCRACICKLRSGKISYQVEWPGVSSEEREAGLFLPCVATARSDVVIDQPLAVRSSMPNVT